VFSTTGVGTRPGALIVCARSTQFQETCTEGPLGIRQRTRAVCSLQNEQSTGGHAGSCIGSGSTGRPINQRPIRSLERKRGPLSAMRSVDQCQVVLVQTVVGKALQNSITFCFSALVCSAPLSGWYQFQSILSAELQCLLGRTCGVLLSSTRDSLERACMLRPGVPGV
jgi:hypothetical protein